MERRMGEGKIGSTGYRNISLSIRRKTRWTPCLTGASFKGSEILNLVHNLYFIQACVSLCVFKQAAVKQGLSILLRSVSSFNQDR